MTRVSLRTVLAWLLLATGAASAHDADILYIQAHRATPESPEVREVMTLTPEALARLLSLEGAGAALNTRDALAGQLEAIAARVWDAAPLGAGGQPCTRGSHAAAPRRAFVELSATFTCPRGPLRQRFALLARLPPEYRVILGSVREGELPGAVFADVSRPEVALPDGVQRMSLAGRFAGWVGLGMRHIFEGVDHLAFLLAVLLVGGSFKRVLWLVTSFTVAHSLTLGAAALGWVMLDGARARWVEAAIAASIIYVALENLILREHRHRGLVTFLFGLIHGFGFAGVLAGYGLGESVATALLGFNVGVELGQAVVVAVLLPILRMLQRRPALHTRTVRAVSSGILAAGGFWMVERALG
ncbi:HupE/UreJ family protein [Comamonas sp. JC664]|uniref:HupE/UreJ family protein n=1 Tax=Comamonas sp. JC664 TaxID=2801917 RepID=UPI00174E6EA6|nr:HupE/UreJ family protein [Comamonas sp. JC664]MBL0696760.1 HupE/UreJ family protein [Comamonas sp. JC664]GHH03154.1 membrane protein [Comamonas sp. KCTC 72670]